MPIMQFDLSQIEWRAAAWLSQDPIMIYEINNGVDQHIAACVDLMELPFKNKKDPESKKNRDHAKVFNFRMIYGGTAYGYYLDQNMPDFSKGKWEKIVDSFFTKYSGLKDWHDKLIATVYKQQGFLEIPTGRRFLFPKTIQSDGSYGYNERTIKNYPVQGISGGDILPLCAVIIRRGIVKYKLLAKPILTVHDSIVFDYPKEEENKLARLCMLTAINLPQYISNYFNIDWNVNLAAEIEIGNNYGSLKELKVGV